MDGMASSRTDVPPPDPNQNDGYLVVLKPPPAFAAWKAESRQWHRDTEAVASYSVLLRTALPTADVLRYRGVQRYPVDRWWEGEASGVPGQNERARRRIYELYGPNPCLSWTQPPWFDPDLLSSLDVAREIAGLTDEPVDREVVRVTRGTVAATPDTLGFDVGYWGSDHFSPLADAMLLPRWHACPPEQLSSLEPWVRRLNQNMLFRTAVEATEYRRWYLVQPWAEDESEPEEFQVIRVDLAV